ncbi:MAG TPA: diguanylate cyclase [Patescibacteria group bacterium]|nr:diguanylate cyclase [Patescibacteria group bacterium]
MLKDFLANAGMLVSFISIYYQLFRSSAVNSKSPINFRVLSGVIMGLLGSTLMLFSVHLPNNVVIDFRNLAIILSTFNGGWISATISLLLISAFRVMINGFNSSSITAIFVLIIIALISTLITNLKINNRLKWLLSVSISILVTCLAFIILIKDTRLRTEIMWSYSIALSIISFLLYYYILYLEALTESFRRYKQESKRDFLTGLNNVRQFDNLYNEVIENAISRQEMVSLLFIDIDFFKKVNDTYGHKEGDLVLKKLGEILINTCRSMDIVSRNGGEEFSVILIDSPPNRAFEIAERIRRTVENVQIELTDNSYINITVSIGISSYPNPVSNYDMLIEKADEALYEAKRTGRNKVVLYK